MARRCTVWSPKRTRAHEKPKSLLLPANKPCFGNWKDATGREDIANFLLGSGNPRASRLLDMMLDPAYKALSFGQLCSRAGLSGAAVMRLIIQRQLAEGMIRMARHLPDIMEDVTLAALDHNVTCMKCAGNGNALRCSLLELPWDRRDPRSGRHTIPQAGFRDIWDLAVSGTLGARLPFPECNLFVWCSTVLLRT